MEEIYQQWRSSLKQKQRKRLYRHFDNTLDLDNEEHFKRVIDALKNIHTHQFLPLIKFVKKDIRYRRDKNKVPRRKLKERPIMYASHLDAHIYSFYAYLWAKNYEDFLRINDIQQNSIAYRKIAGEGGGKYGKNNIAFAQEVFEHIKSNGTCSVILADISKFFDSLNHKILKDQLTLILGERLSDDEYKILRSLMAFRFVLNDNSRTNKINKYTKLIGQVEKLRRQDNYSLVRAVYEAGGHGFIKENKTTIGIPQGSPLSGLLANIYMAAFDANFVSKFPNVLYRRYSDDIAVVCSITEVNKIFSVLRETIKICALDINPSKAFIATFRKNGDGSVTCIEVKNGEGETLGKKYIDYLGFEFDGHTVRVRGKTLQNTYRKADKKIKNFYARQFYYNPRKRHNVGELNRRNSSGYLKNAERVMASVGHGIKSQRKKFAGFIRRKKMIIKQS